MNPRPSSLSLQLSVLFVFLLFLSTEAKVTGDFQVENLRTGLEDCTVTETTGDDSVTPITGPLFVSRSSVHISSHKHDARYLSRDLNLEDSSPISHGFSILQDISTAALYFLADSELRPIKWNQHGHTVQYLLPLDPLTGDPVPDSAIRLLSPILLNGTIYVVLLSGYGEGMIVTPGTTPTPLINYATGEVTFLTDVLSDNITFSTCGQYGSWYSYGVLEKISTGVYSALTATKSAIFRHNMQKDESTLVANFTSINGPNNLCSLFVSLSDSRWYWSSRESISSSFFSGELGAGHCDLSFTKPSSEGTTEFAATEFSVSNCKGTDVYNYVGKNAGLVYPSTSRVFVSSYSNRITLNSDLEPLTPPLPFPAAAVVTDYKTGKIYCLASRFGVCINSQSTVCNKLVELDPVTGKPTSESIKLSINIDLKSNFFYTVVASGAGEAFIFELSSSPSNGYLIDFSSGDVRTFDSISSSSLADFYYPNICESPFLFGVLEKKGSTRSLLISTTALDHTGTTIVRFNFEDDTTTALFTLGKLHFATICSFHLAPSSDRWYFMYEGIDILFGLDSSATKFGYCDAKVTKTDGDFFVSLLTTDNCKVKLADNQVGEDVGPIYLSPETVFLLGGSGLGTYEYSLAPKTKSIFGYFSVISDLRTGSAYTLMSSDQQYLDGGEMAYLQRFDPETQVPISTIALSTPIQVGSVSTCQTLFYQGYEEFGIIDSSNPRSMTVVEFGNGEVTVIPLPNDLSSYNPHCCQKSLTVGLLERIGDKRAVLYPSVSDGVSSSIDRFDLATGTISKSFKFKSQLGAICGFSLSIPSNRWYFSFDQTGTPYNFLLAGGNTFALGACDAKTNVVPPVRTPSPTPKATPADEKTFEDPEGSEVEVDFCPDPELPYGCNGKCVSDLQLCLPRGVDPCEKPEDCLPSIDLTKEDTKVVRVDVVVISSKKPLNIDALTVKGQYIGSIRIPPGTFRKGTVVRVTSFRGDLPEDEDDRLVRYSAIFDVTALSPDGKELNFENPITISILAVLPDGKEPSDVCMGYNHGRKGSKWTCEDRKVSSSRVKGSDGKNIHLISLEITHFTGFAVLLGTAAKSFGDLGTIDWLSFAFLIAGGFIVAISITTYYFYHRRKVERTRLSLIHLAAAGRSDSFTDSLSHSRSSN